MGVACEWAGELEPHPCWGKQAELVSLMAGDLEICVRVCEGHRLRIVTGAYVPQPAVLALAELGRT